MSEKKCEIKRGSFEMVKQNRRRILAFLTFVLAYPVFVYVVWKEITSEEALKW